MPDFSRFIDCIDADELELQNGRQFNCRTVIPSHIIDSLLPESEAQYGRVGGMHYEYLGERRFRGTINIIYEVAGKSIAFNARGTISGDKPCKLYALPENGVVCLW